MRHVARLIGLCVVGVVAVLVLGTVAASGEEATSPADTTVHQADFTGTTASPDTEESAVLAEPSGVIGIGPDTERQMSVPDEGSAPTREDRDMTREQDILASTSY